MQSRREFLRNVGVLAVSPAAFFERTEPELILFNANIITVDDRQSRAQAVAIADGRFLAVGSNDKVRALASGRTKKINLEGRTVVPGFIDAHTHPAVAGRMHLRQVDCDLRCTARMRRSRRTSRARSRASNSPIWWCLGAILYAKIQHRSSASRSNARWWADAGSTRRSERPNKKLKVGTTRRKIPCDCDL